MSSIESVPSGIHDPRDRAWSAGRLSIEEAEAFARGFTPSWEVPPGATVEHPTPVPAPLPAADPLAATVVADAPLVVAAPPQPSTEFSPAAKPSPPAVAPQAAPNHGVTMLGGFGPITEASPSAALLQQARPTGSTARPEPRRAAQAMPHIDRAPVERPKRGKGKWFFAVVVVAALAAAAWFGPFGLQPTRPEVSESQTLSPPSEVPNESPPSESPPAEVAAEVPQTTETTVATEVPQTTETTVAAEVPQTTETTVAAEVPEPSAAVANKAELTKLRIASVPVSATLTLDGARVDNPYAADLEFGTAHVLTVSAAGYEPKTVTFRAGESPTLSVVLDHAAPATEVPKEEAASVEKPKTKPKSKHSSRHKLGAGFVTDNPY